MKRLILLSMLTMIAPLTTSCNNGKCTLEVNTNFCIVDGLKDQYNSGERVELTLNPYPYFELPAEKFISIYGASNVDYDYANKKIAFNINQNASLSFSTVSSFGGKEIDSATAESWLRNADTYGIRLDYKYSFEEPTDQAQRELILALINLPLASPQLTNFSGEFHTSNPTEINDESILTGKTFSSGSTYIANIKNQQKPSLGDEMAVYSTNIKPVKGITGISGYGHWVTLDKDVCYCDYAYLSYNNAIVREETEGITHYSDPINGYAEMRVVCGKNPEN